MDILTGIFYTFKRLVAKVFHQTLSYVQNIQFIFSKWFWHFLFLLNFNVSSTFYICYAFIYIFHPFKCVNIRSFFLIFLSKCFVNKSFSISPIIDARLTSVCVLSITAECLMSGVWVDTQSKVEGRLQTPLWSSAAERKINSSIPF